MSFVMGDKMDRNCFVCTTPYQILAAVTLACNDDTESDLVIVPQFGNAGMYAERIDKTKVFRRVVISDFESVNRYKNRQSSIAVGVGIVQQYLRVKKTVPQYLGDVEYSKVLISSQAIVGRLISLYYLKRGAEIVYFDDGEGSYDDVWKYEAKGIDRKIRSVLFGKKSIGLGTERILYCPELYEKTFGNKDHVSKIPNWAEDKDTLSTLNDICGYSDSAQITHDVILLDTIPSETFDEAGQAKYCELFDLMVQSFGKTMIVKKHPRDKRDFGDVCEVYQYPSIPFELLCANSDIAKKVLISPGSSAVLMPKILFDAEPVVILLHHITGIRVGDSEKREKIISYIRSLYTDPSRFIIPETVEEYKEVLATFLKERNE